jgi:hypothetical protein
LVHLVYLVCLVYLVQGTKQAKQTRTPDGPNKRDKLPSSRPALHGAGIDPPNRKNVEWAGFVTMWGRRMEEGHSIEVIEVLVCASGVAYGLVLAYGIKQEWPWIFDPPEWTSVIYFPTVVKMIWGPKHVRSFAYVTAYGALVMSLICLMQSLVGSLT